MRTLARITATAAVLSSVIAGQALVQTPAFAADSAQPAAAQTAALRGYWEKQGQEYGDYYSCADAGMKNIERRNWMCQQNILGWWELYLWRN
jgi:hypothetical protein